MATKYLDKIGLAYFWSKIKAWCNSLFALDNAVVHKTGNEHISGIKVFEHSQNFLGSSTFEHLNGIFCKSLDIEKNVITNSTKYLNIAFVDKNLDYPEVNTQYSSLLGLLEYSDRSTGANDIKIACYDKNMTTEPSAANTASLYVGWDADGIRYAACPSTSVDRVNGNDIITRNFIPLDTRIVHTTGDEVVTGLKSFSNTYSYNSYYSGRKISGIHIYHSEVTKGIRPSNPMYTGLYFLDSHNEDLNYTNRLGLVEYSATNLSSAHNGEMAIKCYKLIPNQNDDSNLAAGLYVGFDSNDEKYAIAPSTSETRTVDGDILTRDWIPKDTRIVHTTGDESIAGYKTFSNTITFSDPTTVIKKSNNTGRLAIVGGSNANSASGAKLYLHGASLSETGLVAGGFCLQAGNSSGYHQFNGYPDGQLIWDGPDVTVESNIPRIRLKNTAVDSSVTSNTTRFTGSISFADSASSSTLDFNRRTGVIMSGINSNDASFIRLLAYDPEPNSDTYAGIAVGYPRNGSPYAVAPSTLSTRTNGTDIVTRDWIPNDTRIVHTISNETIAGTKTFSSSPIVPTPTAGDSSTKVASTAFVSTAISNNDSGVVHKTGNETIEGEKTFKGYNKSPIHVFRNKVDSGFAAGELAHVFYAEMLSGSTGNVSFGCSPISLIGNDTETAYNVGVRLGSTNGMTLVTAGECGANFTSATGTYNNENIYLAADGTIRMFVGCSNDATSYAGPVVISGSSTKGGTGSTTTITATNFAGNASTATKLATARSLTTKLDSTTAITFDGSANKDNIPVTGILPIANGGTGSSTKNFVDLTTAQEISGIKTHKNHIVISEGASVLTLQMTNVDTTVTSTTNKIHSAITFNDKNDILIKNRTAVIQSGMTSSDENFIYIGSYDPTVNSTDTHGLNIYYPRGGTAYTACVSPASTTDDSKKIATTEWVRDATGNFACNAATATKATQDGNGNVITSTYLPFSGGTVSGTITISKGNSTVTSPAILTSGSGQNYVINAVDTSVTKGTAPSSNKFWGISFFGKDYDNYNKRIGLIETQLLTDNTVKTQIAAYNCTANATTSICSIRAIVDGEGNAYTEAPKPSSTTDNSTKIATTSWIRTATGNTALNAATATDLASGSVLSIDKGGTAGTTIEEAQNNILRPIYHGTGSFNFNDFTLSSIHIFGVNTTLTNCPNGFNGQLITFGGPNLITKQFWSRYGTFDTNDHYLGFRTGNGEGSWSNWHKLYTDSDTIPVSNGGTGLTSLDTFVRTTDDQRIGGVKTFTTGPRIENSGPYLVTNNTSWDATVISTGSTTQGMYFRDKNGVNGGIIQFKYYKNNKTVALTHTVYDLTDNSAQGGNLSVTLGLGTNRSFRPGATGDMLLGRTDYKWKEIWCTQSSINSTSDERLKNSIDYIPENVLDVWENVNWVQYKYNDASEEKGIENARIHTGMIAQQIKTVFEEKNIDVNKYGFFLYDKWEAEEAEYDKDGNLIESAKEAGDQYGLRYVEALCIEAAYQRRKNKILENRISELEKQVSDMIILLQNLTNGNG